MRGEPWERVHVRQGQSRVRRKRKGGAGEVGADEGAEAGSVSPEEQAAKARAPGAETVAGAGPWSESESIRRSAVAGGKGSLTDSGRPLSNCSREQFPAGNRPSPDRVLEPPPVDPAACTGIGRNTVRGTFPLPPSPFAAGKRCANHISIARFPFPLAASNNSR